MAHILPLIQKTKRVIDSLSTTLLNGLTNQAYKFKGLPTKSFVYMHYIITID